MGVGAPTNVIKPDLGHRGPRGCDDYVLVNSEIVEVHVEVCWDVLSSASDRTVPNIVWMKRLIIRMSSDSGAGGMRKECTDQEYAYIEDIDCIFI